MSVTFVMDQKPPKEAGFAAAPCSGNVGMPRFSGEGCVRRFLDDFGRYASLQNWNDEQKVNILPLSLSGIGRDAYDALSKEQQKSYQTAADGLRAAFPQRSAVDYHLALRNLQYDPRDSLDNFLITFRKHVANAFPNQTGDGQGELLFNHFLSTLPDEYYAAVIADGITSFDAAVAKVRNKRNATKGGHGAAVRTLAAEGGAESMLAQLQKRIEQLEARLDNRSSRPRGADSRRQRECFACGEHGHIRWQCAKRDHRCQRCGTVGHVEVVCGRYFQAGNWGGAGPRSGVEPRLQ